MNEFGLLVFIISFVFYTLIICSIVYIDGHLKARDNAININKVLESIIESIRK